MRDQGSCVNLIELSKKKNSCIIWGTKLAARLALDVCKALELEVRAFGDNSSHQEDERLEGIPIISAGDLNDAGSVVVILGSFFCRVERDIKRQLTKINRELIFVPFAVISYYHEILLTDRRVINADAYFKILQNIWIEEDCPWRCQTDHNVLTRYCYKVGELNFDDLLSQLEQVNGIAELCLIINSEKLTPDMLHAIRKELMNDKIGHLILVTDGEIVPTEETILLIKRTFYYVSADCDAKNLFREMLDRYDITYELSGYGSDMFKEKPVRAEMVTEEMIYRSVCEYIEEVPAKRYDDTKQVIIVQLFNGLANQMLMYLFGRFLEIHTGNKVIFDDTVLMIDVMFKEENVNRIRKWLPKASDQEVKDMVEETRRKSSFYYFDRAEVAEVFSLNISLLSDYFDKDTWKKYLERAKREFYPNYSQAFPLGQLLLQNGINISLVQDSLIPNEIVDIGHQIRADVNVVEWPFGEKSVTNFWVNHIKNAYYMGIWATGIDRDWLYYNRNYVRETFKFQVKLDGQNLFYYKNIIYSDAVIIHVRRSDFINVGWAMDEEYVKQSLLKIKEMSQYKNLKYFIFSDDQEWCEENLDGFIRNSLGEVPYFVKGNEGKKSYIDLYLMSMGKIYVPSAVSSFSYLALLLSENLEWYVDVQKYLYYKKENDETVIDLCCFE